MKIHHNRPGIFTRTELEWWMTRILISPAFWCLIVLLLLSVVGSMDLEDAKRADQTYCDMVKEYRATKGEFGWPDYEQKFERDCL